MPRKAEINLKDIPGGIEDTFDKYQLIIENTNDLITILNHNFEHEFINKNAYFNTLGYTEEEIIGKKPREFTHPDDLLRAAKAIRQGLLRGEVKEQFRIRHKDGHYIWLETEGKFFTSQNGVLKTILISREITERKKIEEKLEKSEEKYKLILENANDLITIINEKLIHEYINEKAYFNILGYKSEDIIGKTPLEPLHPEDIKAATKILRNGFKFGEGSSEMRVKHKDGHYIWLENRGKTFTDLDGKKKALIISRDITERKNAERLIIDENKKLLEINQIKSELITTASHELKTPLISIAAASQFLLSTLKEQIGEDALKFVEMIHRGGQRLKLLIENLLDVSIVESGKLSLHLQDENIVEIIDECISDIKYWAEQRNIIINFEHPKELKVIIDRIKIEQVITNLLSNAIKYTPPKGEIHIILNETDSWIKISIKDDGIGLTKKEKEGLFKKFGKIERYGKGFDVESEGSGLGLYISKEIVELHEGKILVESKGRNQGSTFIIRLPKS